MVCEFNPDKTSIFTPVQRATLEDIEKQKKEIARHLPGLKRAPSFRFDQSPKKGRQEKKNVSCSLQCSLM